MNVTLLLTLFFASCSLAFGQDVQTSGHPEIPQENLKPLGFDWFARTPLPATLDFTQPGRLARSGSLLEQGADPGFSGGALVFTAANTPPDAEAPKQSETQPDYIAEFERISQHRYDATDAAGEALLRQYCSDLEPLVRRATEAKDLDTAMRIRAELQIAKYKLECLGRWELENLTDGHKGAIEVHGDGTFSSGLTRLGVWDIEGSDLMLRHAKRGGHHDRIRLPVKDGKFAGHNSMGHPIRLRRPDLDKPPAAKHAQPGEAEASLQTGYSTPVGVWHWFIGPDITIKEDGTVDVETDRGRWAWTDKERRGFQISWEGIKVVDSLILSPDGKRLSGINTRGTRVTGERVK